MDWKKHRLIVGLGVLVGLIVAVVVMTQSEAEQVTDADELVPEDTEDAIPAIDAEKVESLEIRQPEGEPVKVVREGDTWKVVEPLEAEADGNAVNTALDKLADLEVSGVAATKKANHERLEVSDDTGIHVIVTQDGKELAHMLVGAYKGGNTMVRLQGQEQVLSVRGSIKYAFNKELKNWRNRQILEVETDRAQRLQFEHGETALTFVRGADGKWRQGTDDEPIEEFDPANVKSIVSRLGSMRATDFAGPDVTADKAGLVGEGASTVTVFLGEAGDDATGDGGTAEAASADGGAAGGAGSPTPPEQMEHLVLRVGTKLDGKNQYYFQVEGGDLIYVISQYLADQLRPEPDDLKKGAKPAKAPGKAKMPMKMGGMGGGGAKQLPPGMKQKIMRKLQQQKAMQKLKAQQQQ